MLDGSANGIMILFRSKDPVPIGLRRSIAKLVWPPAAAILVAGYKQIGMAALGQIEKRLIFQVSALNGQNLAILTVSQKEVAAQGFKLFVNGELELRVG